MARNKRKRRRRKGRFGLLFKALCFVALAGALVFGATVFFQVETVAVTGNARYKQEEIVAAAGIQTGDNLYRLNKNEIYRQVLQKLPYIESISIRRSLPSTIVIDVTEWDAVAQILPGAAGSASAARTAAQEDAAAQTEGETSADPGASSGDSSGDKSGDQSKEKPSDSSKKAEEKPEQKPATEAWLISVGGKLLEKLSTMGLSDQAEADPDDHTNLESVVTEQADIEQSASAAIDEYKGLDISEKGKVYDLIVPILVLIFFSILGMMYTGGFFEGVDFATAVGENPVGGLCIGATVALCVAGAMFLPRGLTTLSGFVESISEGVRSMVGAIMILVLAWSLGGCCRYMLGTGDFVSSFLNSLGVSLAILPCIIFLVAGFIGFAMGTSWGTIALILPIVVGVFNEGDPLFLVAVGATLAGAVYGDHISPISDTTILSSAGAKCNHLRHVATQLPYATTVMVVCFVCYIVAGFTGNPWISLVLGAVLIVVAVKILHKSNIGMKK